jgi:spore maturation protein CgeB
LDNRLKLPKFRILYVGPLVPHENVLHRFWALERLGQTVFPLDERFFDSGTGRLMEKLRYRLQSGSVVRDYNEAVFSQATGNQVDVVWGDKQVYLRPETLRRLRRHGIASVDFTIDNPFGPRNDPGWRTYKRSIGEYDLHVLQRDSSLADFMRAGARHVMKCQTTFERAAHFPPPAGWSDKDRDREVSFVGSPYDQRVEFFTRLRREFEIPLTVSGMRRWAEKLPTDVAEIYTGSELLATEYRRAIWRSKINLSFITHSNLDEYALKTFEIAGCAGFQIAERSPGHSERFIEDEEIVLFSSVEECAAKIRRYLPDEAARERIGWAGHRRAVESGYDNDSQLARVLIELGRVIREDQISAPRHDR